MPPSALAPGLEDFLKAVANTKEKVCVLQLFLTHSGICVSSAQLAAMLNLTQTGVRSALTTLHEDGALTYCPYFGNADLCLMNSNYLTTAMKRDLRMLSEALESQPELVWKTVAPVSSQPLP